MTISDQTRHRLHQRLDEVLGPEDAATLMEHLPPVGWADVAVKRDLDHLGVQLRAEMSVGFAELRKEMNVGFADVRAELHKEIAGLRADMARQTSTLLVGLLGLQVSAAALTLSVSRLM